MPETETCSTRSEAAWPRGTWPSAQPVRHLRSSTSTEETRRYGTLPGARGSPRFRWAAGSRTTQSRSAPTAALSPRAPWTTRSCASGTSAPGSSSRELDQGSAGSLTLDFSADGRTLAVSGFEPVASLWDVATGVRIGPTLTAGSRRAEIDLSPDGRRLLLTHADGRGAIWDVDPESWARRACALANRTLTFEEWEEFLPGRPYEPACAT